MTAFFDHVDPIAVGEREYTASQILDALKDQLTANRRARIEATIQSRIFGVAPVLDGLYDRGNVSAVMRTAEGLGFGALQIIESQEEGFKAANRVTQGADKWLEVIKWPNPSAAMAALNARGVQIVATTLSARAVPLADVSFARPTAIVFGNERDGVSDEVLDAAHVHAILPMRGFAQSFNISVAAALTLYHSLHAGVGPDLGDEQIELLRAVYFLRSVERHAAILERTFHDS